MVSFLFFFLPPPDHTFANCSIVRFVVHFEHQFEFRTQMLVTERSFCNVW